MIPCYKSLKILFDKIIAFIAFVLLFPLMLALVGIVFYDQRKVFFIQQRPGLLGTPFLLYKFQTMKDGPGTDAQRVSKVGRWLRAFSMDELPQLYNILKGDMSFVGPRPLLMEYMDYYSDEHHRRHWVMPGITGWAQVQGGNSLSWEEKLDLDCEYVNKFSFLLDVKIVVKTVQLLLKGEKEHFSPSKFSGY